MAADRRGRRLLLAILAAVAAGVAATLGLAAAADAWLHDGAALLVALAAVWVGQAIPPLTRTRRHR